jgi:hypothetical protein
MFDDKGQVQLKPGSNNVWEYRLGGINNIVKFVIPFFNKYVIPFSSKKKEFFIFQEIVIMLYNREHFIQEGLIKIVKLAYSLNEFGKGKKRKRTLEEIETIILRDHTPNKNFSHNKGRSRNSKG